MGGLIKSALLPCRLRCVPWAEEFPAWPGDYDMMCAFQASLPDPITQSSFRRPGSILKSTNILSSFTGAIKRLSDQTFGERRKCWESRESADSVKVTP